MRVDAAAHCRAVFGGDVVVGVVCVLFWSGLEWT